MDVTALPEEWRAVVGNEGAYEVSSWGRVRSLDRVGHRPSPHGGVVAIRYRGRNLRPAVARTGHLYIAIDRRVRYIHRLVIEAFVGPQPPGMECCHLNGDASDNRPENLRWGTRSDNMRDKVLHGTDHNASKTHCPRGHVLAAPNLVARPGPRRRRGCLACNYTYPKFNSADPRFSAEADRHYCKIMGGAS
jgi:hypothetical protein